MNRFTIQVIHESHLDLFWLGTPKTCLERGSKVIKQYVDRCLSKNETYLIETVVFLRYFLEKYPDYAERVKQLWNRGQLDIGAAYVDVWQNLVLGESHIRNLQEGRAWLRDHLQIESAIASHPDLPGMVAQVSQIYSQSGVEGYVTSRKIAQDGRVWAHESPDGSRMKVYNHPLHYILPVLIPDDEEDDAVKDWRRFPISRLFPGFPLGRVLLSGGSGDLTDMETFKDRYGKSLEEYVRGFAECWPEYDFSFGRFTELLAEYSAESLPVGRGEIPSVWGVACDESVRFFRNARLIEGKILTAEKLLSLLLLSGGSPEVVHAQSWQGVFDDGVFFGREDIIRSGEELRELWKMHVFSQDHNGGGKEGAASEFIKLRIQDRLYTYTNEIIHQSLAAFSPTDSLCTVFNPHSWDVTQVVELPNLAEKYAAVDAVGNALPMQTDRFGRARVEITLCPFEVKPIYSQSVDELSSQVHSTSRISNHDDWLEMENESLLLRIDRKTGNLKTFFDKRRRQEWGHDGALELLAHEELGTDVDLRVNETEPLARQRLLALYISEAGPLYSSVTLEKEILGARVIQDITLWCGPEPRLDVRTKILWHGETRRQIRMVLPSSPAMDGSSIVQGSPFFEASWDEVVEGSGPFPYGNGVSRSDWERYREIQLYAAVSGTSGRLVVATLSPGIVRIEDGWAAVLLRTPPSCGDPKFYWDNAGEQVFEFAFHFSDVGVPAVHRQRLGYEVLQPAIVHISRGERDAGPTLRPSEFTLDGDGVIVSAMYPEKDGIVLRLFEANGEASRVTWQSDRIDAADVIDLTGKTLDPGVTAVNVSPHQIVSLRMKLTGV